jgi:hypothetical protein
MQSTLPEGNGTGVIIQAPGAHNHDTGLDGFIEKFETKVLRSW